MRTLLPDPPPPEFEALLERRRQWGADHHDEAWEGVLHMNPAPQLRHADVHAQLLYLLRAPAHSAGLRVTADFNLGEPGDYRVPDGGLHHPGEAQLYCTTAALAVEVLSPGDETWNKLPFYADHQVDEVLIVDPDEGGQLACIGARRVPAGAAQACSSLTSASSPCRSTGPTDRRPPGHMPAGAAVG